MGFDVFYRGAAAHKGLVAGSSPARPPFPQGYNAASFYSISMRAEGGHAGPQRQIGIARLDHEVDDCAFF
ncbi:hypothetical protein [Methylocystis sp.]|uniref:hypothetical protein n=1 Tax=Methylocystis sp. TaxID=1911079 RepID=UPI003DA3C4CF